MLGIYFFMLFLLSLILMMTSVQSKVVLEELPPQEEPRHDLFKRVGVSNLDLQRMETFLWGGKHPWEFTYHSQREDANQNQGSSKGVSILGNLTIYSSSEHERILALERAKTYIQSICCTDNSVNVTFNDDIFFASARHAWDWINREYNRTLIVIVGGGDCEWNSHRLPFHVSGIRFDEIKKKATFNASLSNWQQLARIYDLHLDSVHPDHPVFQRRSGIGNFFNDIGHDIKSVFSGVTPATQIADTVISDITSGAVGAVNTVTSVVPSVASPAISDITSKAVGAVNTAASIVPSVATSVISEVTSHAIGAISTVSSIASSDFSLATSVAHSIATSIANEAKAVVTGALGDMMDGGILIPFNMSVPSYTWSTGNGDLNIAIDCSNCGVSGGFDVQFHAHGNWSNVLNLDLEQAVKVNITLSPRDVSMKIEPKILVSANISGAQTNEQQLLDIPLWEAGGLRIPGVLSIGPHGVVSVGYELKDLTGFMNVSTGTAVSLPNNARAELLLELPLPHVSASSWHASISHVPFDIDGRLQGGLKIYAKAELQIQAEGMGKSYKTSRCKNCANDYVGNGFDAYINLQPYIGANISLTDCKHPPLNGKH